MTAEELARSPVIRMAGSDGHTYETTADRAHEMADAARQEGVALKPFLKTEDAEGNVHEISPFDGEGLKAAQDRGDVQHFDEVKEDYFSGEALKAGATRFAIGLVNPWDWLRGIGTAATTVVRGFAKGTVGTGIKAFRGATYLGESLSNAVTGDDDHTLSDSVGKLDEGFNKLVNWLTPEFFELTGEYDGVEGAKEATGTVRNVAELVANVKGIGSITKGLAASEVAAAKAAGVVDTAKAAAAGMKVAHTATGALFGLGKYADVASDPNGPGGVRQQVAALVAGSADAVFFGLWNPLKVSQKYAQEMSPFMEATRKEIMKRVMLKVGQAVESGATMALVEAVKQGAEQVASIGTEKVEGVDKEGNKVKNWAARTLEESAMEVGAQFLVGSAFVALDVAEQEMGRFGYNRARKAQGEIPEGLSDKMKVAMSYQVERNRRAYAPERDRQARFALQAKLQPELGSANEAYKYSPDVKTVGEDGSVTFKDGSVWRLDPRMEGGATITVSDGTILSERGELLGYRARQESGAQVRADERGKTDADAQVRADERGKTDADAQVRAASNSLVLLQQIDEGALPIKEVELAAVEPIAPTENGNEIAEWDPQKYKPIVVLEDLEGNLKALTGGKRILAAKDEGLEKLRAVVVREADGWTAEEAAKLSATENLRQGLGTLKNVVEAVDSLGEEDVLQLAGWHQANGSREFASTLRRGLKFAGNATPELKAALEDGRISDEFAANAAGVLSMERLGENWQAAQKAVTDLVGNVGKEELEAVLWGVQKKLSGKAATPEEIAAAVQECREEFNRKHGGADSSLDSDTTLVETGKNELKTIGEVESSYAKATEDRSGMEGNGERGETEPLYAAAEAAKGNKAVELKPIAGSDGTFTTLAFPDAKIKIDGERKVIAVDGLTVDDFAGMKVTDAAALVASVEAKAAELGLDIGFYDDGVRAAWEGVKENIKAEGAAAHERRQLAEKSGAVVDMLQKSFPEAKLHKTAEEWAAALKKHHQELHDGNGEIYAFVDPESGDIYLNPDYFGTRQALEAPIHEYGHLGIIATKKVNKAVYDRGMKLANDFLDKPETAGDGAVRGIVDFILSDPVYSKQAREVQCEELLAQLIGKRGEEALRAETNKTVVGKIKSWLVEFWNTFGKALGLKEITPEQAEKMTVEEVADAIRAEMFSGRKYGEGLKGVEFADGGARAVTKPVRVKRKLTGRRKAVNEFVKLMGGAEDPANTESDMLALWVDNGGRLFDKLPFESETSYSKGKSGVKKTRSSVADEFAESTAFYQDLDPAQRKVFFGTDKLEYGAIGEGLKNKLAEAGITRFTREDGTIDYEAAIAEFERQWTNYERGNDFLKERGEYEEEAARQYVEEMERAEAAEREAMDEISAEEAAARSEMEAADAAAEAQIAEDIAAGRFSRGKRKLLFSRSGIFTGSSADYANRSRDGGKDDGPSIKKIGSGEGSQVYGWGLYGSTVRGIAEKYSGIVSVGSAAEMIAAKHRALYGKEDAIRILEDRLADKREDYILSERQRGDYEEAVRLLREGGLPSQHIYEQTWFTNREPGDESHLLKWYDAISDANWDRVIAQAEKEGLRDKLKGAWWLRFNGDLEHFITDNGNSGDAIYERLSKLLGGPQSASEFLARAGIDGVKYPVDSYGGKTVKDGDKVGWNYVAFSDDNIRVDHKWTDGQLRFSRAVKPSALGDGKQRYYEVPFDKAVDKIVKNKKPVSDDHVFVSETPKAFADIGFAKLPVMMGQGHVISCYFGEGEGVEGKHLHKLKGNLKLLPKALEKPLMIITSESSPSDSVVAILKMKDNTGASVIVPVKMSGVGRVGKDLVDAHIALTMFGKKNAWKSLVANAIEKETNGEVGVFYIDGAESKTILERLGGKAKGLGISGLQSPSETKAHRNPENGRSGLQSPSRSISQGTLHSIADEGSPVKGGIVSPTATQQFKNWFGASKVVDANGEPLVVYRRDNDEFTVFDHAKTQQNDAGWLGKGFYFYGDKGEAERATGYGKNLRSFYLKAENPYYITPEEYNRLAEADDPKVSAEFTQRLKDEGYDSVYWNGDLRQEWMVLDSNQVKSATDNIGTFDPGNPDVRFSRGTRPEAKYVKLTRVADDAGAGEQTPGALAASRELSRQGATPLTTRGTRYVSLPLSEMNALARWLTGHAMPAEMSTGRKLGVPGKASTKHRKLVIAADVVGSIDKTDAANETATLKQHGFFRNEDPNWVANHSPVEVRQERVRSEEALSTRLEALADRRAKGTEPGGMAAGRKVFADQLAKVVMSMPHGQPGVLGAMQTVGGALERRVRGNDAEADAFLDWMEGRGTGNGQQGTARSPQERKAGMFGAFLMMPKEMEQRARGWYDAIRSTIAGDQKLADAFRMMTVRSMTEQGYSHLEKEILRAQSAQTEQALKKLSEESNAPIAAGGLKDRAAETVVLSCHDRMGAALVRVDASVKLYLAAQKKLMASAPDAATKAAIKQQTDLFMGAIAQAKNQAELSRTAWERGHNNVDARYLYRMVDILNEATVRDGLKMEDVSLYLDQQRVIETKGLSGSRGESARQAQLILDAMKRRLGAADYAKVEAFARKFAAIHEQELLNDPVLERILGKGTVDYWRGNTHYVTTKRQFSPEELAEIEAARAAVRAANGGKGDDVVDEMFKFAGRAGMDTGAAKATARLKGSFSDKQEVMSATFEKVAAIKRWLRRCEYVIELRDLLKLTKVEGVHDFAAGEAKFPDNNRYGHISYMENGRKRVLVVPKEIADGFKAQREFDTPALKLCAGVNNIARQLWIDWNPVYWQRNIGRNVGSIEMNMPGMKESAVKRGLRFVFPGLAPTTEIALTHLVRHMPEKMSLPLRKIWGEHTALFYAPKAKRMAMWLTDHNEMQKRLWEAQDRGDLGTVQEMLQDQRDMLDALRGNMLVGMARGEAGGTTAFLDDSVRTVGKTMAREIQEMQAKPKWRRALEAANIFSKNAKQQVFEDVMAKFAAYLHDRAQFGTGNNRTVSESGLAVKKNVSIGEGERKGKDTRAVQAIFQPFWNMVEKGVVRNVKAYGERPGETFQKAAWRIAPMILHGLVGSGAIAAWILKANDGDEDKVLNGPMADVYRYARDAQRAYQNCSNYVRENYHVTPLMTDGYTSIVLGMPLTDEERLLKPIARFVTDAASVAAGTKESLDVAKALHDATLGVVAPDFKLAGALPTLFDDTIHALWDNPNDYYTGGQKYDNDIWLNRNENWEMRGKFAMAMAKRLWNDFGGRNVLPVDRAGVDNGLGRAPGWVAKMVNDIPLASPILRSFVKVQVGSPKRDAAEITEVDNRRRAACRVHAKELFEIARREKRDLSLDRDRYTGMLKKWQQSSESLSDEDLAYIEQHYLNAWRAYEGAQYRADGEREKFRAKADKLGLEAAHLWLDFD